MIPAQKEAIYVDNLLLRGSVVRNIEWVVGVVVFTGDDTKIMMNSGETPSKRSRIEKSLNFQITTQFGLLFILCFLSALLGGIYYGKDDSFQDEFVVKFQTGNSRSAPFFGFLTFWTSLILYQTIVPISLYVTIEIVKSYQAFFIASDKDMYDEKTGKRCIPKAWNLSDDLGQVEYIFSDKTGTLTQNIMEFRQCTIGGTIYGELFDEEHSAGELATARGEMETQLTRMFNNPYRDANSSFVSTTLYPDLEPEGRQSRSIIEFFTILAICHTVLA
ncbi:phospholipid transporting ATPase, partial [Spiromyces aspiralis]